MPGPALARGHSALDAGRWAEARAAFEVALAEAETGEGCLGLAVALWWLGENRAGVDRCTRAYTLFRRGGDDLSAARAAIWLGITYKSDFANFAAANGWLGRAERLLDPVPPGVVHGWLWVGRAYRMADLDTAEELTGRAFDIARSAGDVDLELVGLAQLGLIRVGKGNAGGGFALLDEAVAAAMAGERSSLDTVVYTCCDMLNACELADDLERAAQWCQVADDFVATYGCPFLYAECRIYYGSVLTAKGRWQDAERELAAALRITDGACRALYAKALIRLATLRVRQGRLEDADQLLADLGAAARPRRRARRRSPPRARAAAAATTPRPARRGARPARRRAAGRGVSRPGGGDGGEVDRRGGGHGHRSVDDGGHGRPGSRGDEHRRRECARAAGVGPPGLGSARVAVRGGARPRTDRPVGGRDRAGGRRRPGSPRAGDVRGARGGARRRPDGGAAAVARRDSPRRCEGARFAQRS
jgi:tetratricopeptide (TPR) repeat protein